MSSGKSRFDLCDARKFTDSSQKQYPKLLGVVPVIEAMQKPKNYRKVTPATLHREARRGAYIVSWRMAGQQALPPGCNPPEAWIARQLRHLVDFLVGTNEGKTWLASHGRKWLQ